MENSKYSEIHLHHQFNIKKWLISIFLLLILSTPCLAKTQAHVVIQNQATASYFNPATGVGSVVLSNIAEIQVAAVYSFSLVEDHIIKAGPSHNVNFSHVLTNNGNVKDTYDISIWNVEADNFDFFPIDIFIDSNINGRLDPGELRLSEKSVVLDSGESEYFVISANLPNSVSQDMVGEIGIQAKSRSKELLIEQNTDAVSVDLGVMFRITKSNLPICVQLIEPGDTITYRIEISNLGYKNPNERKIRVMTKTGIQEYQGILIEDTIPVNTLFNQSQTLNFSPIYAIPIVMLANNVDVFWTGWDAWDGVDTVVKIGLIIPLENIDQGSSGHLSFSVKVVDNATTGTIIQNRAILDFNGDGQPEFESNETCNKVFGDSAKIQFVDSEYNKTQNYQLQDAPKYIPERDNVYVELISSSFNENPHIADQVVVTVRSDSTGDTIDIRLFETGKNTCVFRSHTPLILVENKENRRKRSTRVCREGGFCTLQSQKIDILTCEVIDPIEGRIKDIASIEPFGYVFDSISLAPIQGAVVSLHNIDGSEILDVYDNPILPETSNEFGRYQFTNVIPGEGYYLQVTPPDTHIFPSVKPPHMMAFKYIVKDGSYGRNGFINLENSGVFSLGIKLDSLELDIPLDPKDMGQKITLEKSVEKPIIFLGQSVSYSLTIHNQSGSILSSTKIYERLPDGFEYLPATLQRSDQEFIDEPIFTSNVNPPQMNQPPNLIIAIGKMDIDETLVLKYSLRLTSDVLIGSHVNSALVSGIMGGAIQIDSLIATASVDVVQGLYIKKTTTDAIATVDQPVWYNIHVKNISGIDLKNMRIWDWLPQGFIYVNGSSRLNENNIGDPEIQLDSNNDVQEMIFNIGDFSKDETIELLYDLKPTLRALGSDRINTARAVANLIDGQVISSSISDAVIHLQTGPLILEKTTTIKTVNVGEWVPYQIKIKNNTGYMLNNLTLFDSLPYGFAYEKGSARLTDQTSVNVQSSGSNLRLFLPDLAKDQEIKLSYILRTTPGALNSDGINAAYVTGITDQNEIKQSIISRAKVDVQADGVFSDQGIIFGKIFIDSDDNKIQTDGEWPIGGVKLFLEDGTWVMTDENGQFSIYGISTGLHVLKLDPLTLPSNVQLRVTDDTSQAGDPGSRFVDLSPGEFYRADFILTCPCENRKNVWAEIKARNDDIRGEWVLDKALEFNDSTAVPTPTPSEGIGDISTGLVYPGSTSKKWQQSVVSDSNSLTKETLQLPEERIKQYTREITREMGRKGVFLWPKSDIARDGKFIAVVRMGIEPNLQVNGQTIPKDRLGEHAFNKAEDSQVLAWYGIKLSTGKNKVAVVAKDPFGNHRILIEKEFYAPGPPDKLRLSIKSNTLPADGGRSILPIEVRLEDQNQKPASGIHFVTLEIETGIFQESDIQPNEPGHQVRIENGSAIVHLRSSDRTGTFTLYAHMGQNLTEKIDILMTTPKRPIIAVGLVDLSLNLSHLSKNSFEPTDPEDDFDKEIYSQNRVALFLKGKIKGDVLLTLAYDSKKNDKTELFRDINPNAYYPIYGDASVKGFEAQSTSRLYVKLEKGKHQFMWGDYVTDAKQNKHIRLGRFHRTLTGAITKFETDRNELIAFAARPSHDHFVEEIQANGTAMFYQIQKDRLPVKANSETIEIITRDIDNPGLILQVRRLQRFEDYLIDSFSGYITFHEAIASRDTDGNRVYIRIGYSSEVETQEYNVAGLRLSQNLSSYVTWGGGFSMDDRSEEGKKLSSGFVALKPHKNHEIVTEFASLSHENGMQQGQASRVEYKGQWHKAIETSMSFAHANQQFTNPDASIASGRKELKGEIIYTPIPGTKIKTSILQSKGLDANDERISAILDLQHQFLSVKTNIGYRHTEQTNTADNDIVDSLRLQMEKSFSIFGRSGKLYGEIEQDIHESDRKSLKVGGEVFVHKKTKIYAEHELINSLDGISGLSSQVERSHTKFGVSSQLMGATETYAEHRIRGGMDGREMESVTGIRNSFDIVPKVTLSPQMEYIHTYKGDDTSDAFSCSLGLNDKRNKNRRTSIRLDTRLGKQSDYYGFLGTHAARFSDNWSGLIREEYAQEIPETDNNRIKHTLSIGGSYRPKLTNRYHLLGLFQWKEERNHNDIAERQVFLFSSHHNYQLNADSILSARIASKWQKMSFEPDIYRSTLHLLGFKWTTNLNLRWGMNVRTGFLTTLKGSKNYSLGFGIDYLIQKNIRIGLGYQFTGFRDHDLDAQRYYAQGLRIGLQLKFDEALFQAFTQ